jgi:hypothetical protein
MKSKYQIGYIGIRVSKLGQAGKLLKSAMWAKHNPMGLNNRNSFKFTKSGITKDQFFSFDFSSLKKAGLDGVAFWVSEAQILRNSSITDHQWSLRRDLSA